MAEENVAKKLLCWYDENKRDLPWRKTKDPYRIWLSEIMLQQTRVEAVKPYYERFLNVCPNVTALAQIPEDTLNKLWEGLGYYSRAKNLQKAARIVAERYGGRMPETYGGLRELPGIGDYTAGAIASIAYNERVPAVDGNVLRVMARVMGDASDITDPKTKEKFREILARIVPERAGDFTQAMIELGATVCVPNGPPACEKCPFADRCKAKNEGRTAELPVKSPKKPRRVEQKTVLIIRDGNRTALRRRPPKGLLAGLYELPNAAGYLTSDELPEYVRKLGFEPLRIERLEDAKHIFTHIEWHMIAYSVRIAEEFDGCRAENGIFLVRNDELHRDYAVPSAFSAYVKYL